MEEDIDLDLQDVLSLSNRLRDQRSRDLRIHAAMEKFMSMREPIPLTPNVSAHFPPPAQMYRHPDLFTASTGLMTLGGYHPPCKRKASWESFSAFSREVARSQHPPKRLFDLPRELRDLIYECCADDTKEDTKAILKEYTGSTIAVVRNAPWASLTLKNRRLSQEYNAAIWRTTELVLIDYFDDDKPLSTPPLHPHLAANLTRLSTVLLAVCDFCEHDAPHHSRCSVYEELKCHLQWLTDLTARLPVLKHLAIKLFVQWPKEPFAQPLRYPRSPHQFDLPNELYPFLQLKGCRRLEVHRCESISVGDGLDSRRMEAEVFDLYTLATYERDEWCFAKEGSETRMKLERAWWFERQCKGLQAWEEEGEE